LTSSAIEIYSGYTDHRVALERIQQAEARGAAARIEQFFGAATAGASSMVAVDETGRLVLTAYHVIRPVEWVVLTEQSVDEAFAPLAESLTRVAAVLVLGLLVALIASVIVARRMVRPIQALQSGAARIGEGVLDQPIEIHSGDELENLADEINGMTIRLRDSYAPLEQRGAVR
jgi:nitrate/nitrite-specific signal transduction histidine kinase